MVCFIRNYNLAKLLLCISFVPLFASCATIFSGTTDDVTFESEPEGATVYIDGVQRGRTPTTIEVNRDTSQPRVRLELDGYQTEQFRLQRNFNTVSILNLGNLIFWGVDLISGAVYRYSPTSYSIMLSQSESAFMQNNSVIVFHNSEFYSTAPVRSQ